MRSPFSYMKNTSRVASPTGHDPAVEPRPRRSVTDAIKDAFGKDAYAGASSPKTQMAVALGSKPVYAGTVAKATIAKRRAANKRARVARRVHRRAGR